MTGINVFSGTKGLGGALTNPTELAFSKGSIAQHYPIIFKGKEYPDVESYYLAHRKENDVENDHLMMQLIATKLVMHARLYFEIEKQGGIKWLEQCSHFTYAKSASFQKWEGLGMSSRFIRNLISAYMLVKSGYVPNLKIQEQFSLFS